MIIIWSIKIIKNNVNEEIHNLDLVVGIPVNKLVFYKKEIIFESNFKFSFRIQVNFFVKINHFLRCNIQMFKIHFISFLFP